MFSWMRKKQPIPRIVEFYDRCWGNNIEILRQEGSKVAFCGWKIGIKSSDIMLIKFDSSSEKITPIMIIDIEYDVDRWWKEAQTNPYGNKVTKDNYTGPRDMFFGEGVVLETLNVPNIAKTKKPGPIRLCELHNDGSISNIPWSAEWENTSYV